MRRQHSDSDSVSSRVSSDSGPALVSPSQRSRLSSRRLASPAGLECCFLVVRFNLTACGCCDIPCLSALHAQAHSLASPQGCLHHSARQCHCCKLDRFFFSATGRASHPTAHRAGHAGLSRVPNIESRAATQELAALHSSAQTLSTQNSLYRQGQPDSGAARTDPARAGRARERLAKPASLSRRQPLRSSLVRPTCPPR